MSSYFGEFFGTMIMIILGNGVVANVCLRRTKAEGGGWMVITAGWAFAVMVAIFCAMAAGAPQADINPALTLIKMLVGIYEPLPALISLAARLATPRAGRRAFVHPGAVDIPIDASGGKIAAPLRRRGLDRFAILVEHRFAVIARGRNRGQDMGRGSYRSQHRWGIIKQ